MHNIPLHNRYHNKLWLELVEPDLYQLQGDLQYCRMGAKPGEDGIDYCDSGFELGFVDPSGGPFISPGFPVGDKVVKQIMSNKAGIYLKVE